MTMANYEIGDLDTLVRLQRCEISVGDNGEKVYNWRCVKDVYAKVERNDDEAVTNDNLEEGKSIRLTIWKVGGLSTRWRILVKGVPYAIEGIDPVSRMSPLCVVSARSIE